MGEDLDAALAGAPTVGHAAGVVCDHLVAAGMPLPSVYLEIAGRLRCLAQRGYWQVHDGVPPGVGILGSTFLRGSPTVIADVAETTEFVAAAQQVVGEVAVPFRHADRVVGVVNVETSTPATPAQVTAVVAAAAALERWLDAAGGVPAETPWQHLVRASTALTGLHDHASIAELAVREATALAGMTSAVLVLDQPAGFVVAASSGPLGGVLSDLEEPTLAAIAGWMRSGASVYTWGPYPGTGFSGSAQVWDAGVQALVTVPVHDGDGNRGFLLVADDVEQRPRTDAVQRLELLAAQLASAIRAADAIVELRRQAAHDQLTGFAHAGGLRADLTARLRDDPAGAALLVIDLDGFKQVNDAHGHLYGNQVLTDLARALSAAAGPEDRLYRIGGDEFAALVATGPGRRAEDLAEAVRAAAAATRHLTVSVGVRELAPADARVAVDGLLADADLAMYQAKAGGGNRVEVYRPDLRRALLARAQLAADLAASLDGQMRLAYQPVVELRGGRVVGAEALLRWHHPTRGLVPPTDFIGVAEEDGQIGGIGAWVLREAAAELARLREATGAELSMSVNVSGVQLDPDLPRVVEQALGAAGLPAGALVAEITESALVDDPVRITVLAALREAGVRIAVDDFGSGYSSLSYLRRLPLDVVKIDRSFVAEVDEPRSAAVLRAVVELAGGLGLTCVAEGVETEAQVAHLLELGCPLAQGYWFSPPTTPEALIDLVSGTRTAL